MSILLALTALVTLASSAGSTQVEGLGATCLTSPADNIAQSVSSSVSTTSSELSSACCPAGAYAAGRVFVVFTPGTTQARAEEVGRLVGASSVTFFHDFSFGPSYYLGVQACDEATFLAPLRAFGDVLFAQLDGVRCIPELPACECCPSSSLICPALPYCPGVLPGSRGAGFWNHQCGDRGFQQVSDQELEALFSEVLTRSTFFTECASIGCETLQSAQTGSDLRSKAARQLLALWLNVASDRARPCARIDLGSLSAAATVSEAIDQIEAILCNANASQADLDLAKEMAESLNAGDEDMELASLSSLQMVRAGDRRTIAFGLVNMSSDTRSYEIAASGTWLVTVSSTRVKNLPSGEIAIVSAEVVVPASALPGETVEIQMTALDLTSRAGLRRDATTTLMVMHGGGGRNGPLVDSQ